MTCTPSGPLFHIKEPEMGSRLTRENSHILDNFLRVNFSDDNLARPNKIKYITKLLFRKYFDSLPILDQNYECLSWSAS